LVGGGVDRGGDRTRRRTCDARWTPRVATAPISTQHPLQHRQPISRRVADSSRRERHQNDPRRLRVRSMDCLRRAKAARPTNNLSVGDHEDRSSTLPSGRAARAVAEKPIRAWRELALQIRCLPYPPFIMKRFNFGHHRYNFQMILDECLLLRSSAGRVYHSCMSLPLRPSLYRSSAPERECGSTPSHR
jgi:hypothetical protein